MFKNVGCFSDKYWFSRILFLFQYDTSAFPSIRCYKNQVLNAFYFQRFSKLFIRLPGLFKFLAGSPKYSPGYATRGLLFVLLLNVQEFFLLFSLKSRLDNVNNSLDRLFKICEKVMGSVWHYFFKFCCL